MTYNSNTSCLCSSNISKSKLNNLNNLNILSSIESIPSLSDIDADINLPYQCNFKYYLTHDFYNSQEISDTSYTQESFSILHCNIRSLTANVDSLSNLLTELSHSFSVIGLSETKLLVGKDLQRTQIFHIIILFPIQPSYQQEALECTSKKRSNLLGEMT